MIGGASTSTAWFLNACILPIGDPCTILRWYLLKVDASAALLRGKSSLLSGWQLLDDTAVCGKTVDLMLICAEPGLLCQLLHEEVLCKTPYGKIKSSGSLWSNGAG